ncbi:hypothetical protein Poli38472_012671 [Pythium oligandrum]|uniref:Protochlorophyllide reductase n=1 Tax=Pythium oligandrum TaxID=41045 RepID=A0A8K1CE26_PYTOL|nr:hypothetical protein Poli38472_012671 [Pythium oligandrum]|eukprot:TMW61480.1 hypothetical protein Poli38472_012671 [Pythium oligandrum]
MTKQVILVTGGNTGLGFQACLDMAKTPNTHVILTGRSAERVEAAVEKIQAQIDPTSTVEGSLLDLGSLKGVQAFATEFKKRDLTIDTLLANAGFSGPIDNKLLTEDGYEMTFGVNHLGHFLLITLLRECVRRVVVVSSEVHNPAEKMPVPPPNVSDLEELAHGYQNFNAGEAYSTSKLCNLFFVSEILRRYPSGTEMLAYSPGLVPDTEFARHKNADTQAFAARIRQMGLLTSTCAYSGGFMARLCLGDWPSTGWKNGEFIVIDKTRDTSDLAKDTALAQKLWEKSEELVSRALAA